MAIALNIINPYDIETYDGLVAFIAAHLELDAESAAQVYTFIRMAEYRLDRMVTVPDREAGVNLSTAASEQTISLPVDFRQAINVRYVADPGYTLDQVSLDELHNSTTNKSGKPYQYAIADGSLHLGPIPDGVYTLRMTYQQRLSPLSASNQTNWLLSKNADAYVYATLWQAAAWLEDIDAATAFRAELMAIIGELTDQGNRYRRSSPRRLRSSVVV